MLLLLLVYYGKNLHFWIKLIKNKDTLFPLTLNLPFIIWYASYSWSFRYKFVVLSNLLVARFFKKSSLTAIYNLWQMVGDKFTKLSKIGFSMECFTADFLQFLNKKHQNLAYGWTAGYSPSSPSISGIFLKIPRQLVRQLVHSLSGDNNLVPLHLWWRQILLKSEKVSKCFVQNCMIICSSSHQRCSIKKGVLRNFTKVTGKHLCQSLFFN